MGCTLHQSNEMLQLAGVQVPTGLAAVTYTRQRQLAISGAAQQSRLHRTHHLHEEGLYGNWSDGKGTVLNPGHPDEHWYFGSKWFAGWFGLAPGAIKPSVNYARIAPDFYPYIQSQPATTTMSLLARPDGAFYHKSVTSTMNALLSDGLHVLQIVELCPALQTICVEADFSILETAEDIQYRNHQTPLGTTVRTYFLNLVVRSTRTNPARNAHMALQTSRMLGDTLSLLEGIRENGAVNITDTKRNFDYNRILTTAAYLAVGVCVEWAITTPNPPDPTVISQVRGPDGFWTPSTTLPLIEPCLKQMPWTAVIAPATMAAVVYNANTHVIEEPKVVTTAVTYRDNWKVRVRNYMIGLAGGTFLNNLYPEEVHPDQFSLLGSICKVTGRIIQNYCAVGVAETCASEYDHPYLRVAATTIMTAEYARPHVAVHSTHAYHRLSDAGYQARDSALASCEAVKDYGKATALDCCDFVTDKADAGLTRITDKMKEYQAGATDKANAGIEELRKLTNRIGDSMDTLTTALADANLEPEPTHFAVDDPDARNFQRSFVSQGMAWPIEPQRAPGHKRIRIAVTPAAEEGLAMALDGVSKLKRLAGDLTQLTANAAGKGARVVHSAASTTIGVAQRALDLTDSVTKLATAKVEPVAEATNSFLSRATKGVDELVTPHVPTRTEDFPRAYTQAKEDARVLAAKLLQVPDTGPSRYFAGEAERWNTMANSDSNIHPDLPRDPTPPKPQPTPEPAAIFPRRPTMTEDFPRAYAKAKKDVTNLANALRGHGKTAAKTLFHVPDTAPSRYMAREAERWNSMSNSDTSVHPDLPTVEHPWLDALQVFFSSPPQPQLQRNKGEAPEPTTSYVTQIWTTMTSKDFWLGVIGSSSQPGARSV